MVIVRMQIEKLIKEKDISTVESNEIESYLLSLGVQVYELGKEYLRKPNHHQTNDRKTRIAGQPNR